MAQLDISSLDDDVRCPECGKRLTADVSACPACGYAIIAHRTRIRCSRCGSRVLADAKVCPHCGTDPHAKRFPYLKRAVVSLLGLLLVVCIGYVLFRALATDAAVRALGLFKPPAVPTQVIQVIYIVASPVPPSPTWMPTHIPSPTSRFTPSPTPRTTRPVTPVLSAGMYPAPQIIAPANSMVYPNAEATIALEWQSVSAAGLRENEWYAITLAYVGRDGSPAEQKHYSKATRWVVPETLWKEASPRERTFKWFVTVIRVDGGDPFTSAQKIPASPNSATRTFIWH